MKSQNGIDIEYRRSHDVEAIFTWRGHHRSFVDFLSGKMWQLHLDSDFLFQFLLCLLNGPFAV